MEPYEFDTIEEYEQYVKDMNAAYEKYVLEQKTKLVESSTETAQI